VPLRQLREELDVHWFELFYDLILIAAIAVTNDSFLDHPSGSTALVAVVGFVGVYWVWLLTTLSRNIAPRTTLLWRLLILVQMIALTIVALAFKSEESIRWSTGLYAYAVALLVVALLIWQGSRATDDRRLLMLSALLGLSAAICIVGAALQAEKGEGWFVLALIVSISSAVVISILRGGKVAYQRDHLRERLGLFVLIVVGEGIAQLVHALFGLEKIPNLGVFGFTFVVVFIVCWLYFDSTIPENFGQTVRWPLLFVSHLAMAIGLIGVLDTLALFAVRQESVLNEVGLSIFAASMGLVLIALAGLAAVSRNAWPGISTVDLIGGIVLIVAAVMVIPPLQPRVYAVMLAVAALLGVVVAANVAYSRNSQADAAVAQSAT